MTAVFIEEASLNRNCLNVSSLPPEGKKHEAREVSLKSSTSFASGLQPSGSKSSDAPRRALQHTLLSILLTVFAGISAHAQITAVTLQSPQLSSGTAASVVSPIHIQATAEDTALVTGYVVYVDGQNVFQNFDATVDAWITLPAGPHSIYVKAWDANTNLATATYQINITGFAPPTPPVHARRVGYIDGDPWTVDNNPNVGGNCNTGSLGSFENVADPNTANVPGAGQHFIMNSACQYDDTLFYWKDPLGGQRFAGDTNFLWDFYFYVPNSTQASAVQALESDLFQAVTLSDGVHEFMFGSQCNYASNQWQFWLPKGSDLTWVDSGISPCRFATGQWHHAVYFLQRVTPGGYQEIPQTFSPATDNNSSLRFGTLTIDGQTMYLGGVAWSTVQSGWSPVLGAQHQLDAAIAGATIEEYLNRESLTTW